MSYIKIQPIIRQAIKEDHCRRDLTTLGLIPKLKVSSATIVVKEPAVICGLSIALETFLTLDKTLRVQTYLKDGASVKEGTKILRVNGNARSILSAERVALNFLTYLSGIATQTAQFVKAVKPFKCLILDTRKTTPTLRALEKYAVRCGGGNNHRNNLEEFILVKDNHHAVLNSVEPSQIVRALRRKTKRLIEIEVESIQQFKDVLKSHPDIVLLDNMPLAEIKQAVSLRNQMKTKQKILLEISGGVTLKTVRQFAATGVDRISIGRLTHTHKAIDMSLEIIS